MKEEKPKQADVVKVTDHKHIVTPSAKRINTSRGMQSVAVVVCPNCGTNQVVKYGYYKDKSITYFKCKLCKMSETKRPYTFPVHMVWR